MSEFDEKVRRKVEQYKTVGTMKNKPETELIDIAKRSVEKTMSKSDVDFDFKTLFTKSEDVKLAKEMLNKYLEDFTVESQADRNALTQLIQLEIWHRHFSEKLEKALHGSNKTPQSLLSTIHRNFEQIRALRDTLGLSSDEGSPSNYIAQLIKRGTVWSEKLNKADRTFYCQHCSKPNLLTFKINQYDPIKHPFFQGRYLTNAKLIKLFLDGKLTEEDIGEIFDTAPRDYIGWLIKKFYNKEHLKKIQQSQEEHYQKSFGKDRILDEETNTQEKSISSN